MIHQHLYCDAGALLYYNWVIPSGQTWDRVYFGFHVGFMKGRTMSGLFLQKNFSDDINGEGFHQVLSRLYGDKPGTSDVQKARYLRLAGLFKDLYPEHDGFRIFSAPGRTEIAGNHTDHQGGHVLCASVDLDAIALAMPVSSNVIRIKSEGHDEFDVIDLTSLAPRKDELHSSAALIRGVAAGFASKGYRIGGFDAYTASNVPKGSGLSSSAAFEILVSAVLSHLYNDGTVPFKDMAIVSQYAENLYFGKPCGLMDQCGCAFGGIMTIDFKVPGSPVVDSLPVDFSDYGYALVITDTGGSHSGLTGDYAAIPQDMKKVASYYGRNLLSEIGRDEFAAHRAEAEKHVGTGPLLRAMHFFSDDARVTAQAEALKHQDIDEFLRLVNESGISSWTLLRNVYSPAHPDLQQVALGLAVTADFLGRRGASRVHGGGFAGTIQAFVPSALLAEYQSLMESFFGKGASCEIRIRNLPASEPFYGLGI
jgi:galactokinase